MRLFFSKSFCFTFATIVSSSLSAASQISPAVTDATYQAVQAANLDNYRISSQDIAPYIQDLLHSPIFETKQVGQSFLGKPIYSVSIGEGPVRVLLWSQMHGDEPTATPALLDLFNYIAADEQLDWRNSWKDKLTLKFIPMLNPDGADKFQRFNAQGIDINRDAQQQQTPEGRLLLTMATSFKPHFGFNLHDQSRHYAAGNSGKPATISVLAPAYNDAREINTVRANAMRLIGDLVSVAERFVPNQIARYDDEYSYRAFGDTLTKMGVSTILIESGGNYQDPHRQTARRVNFEMLVAAIDNIASEKYKQQSLKTYNTIPMNKNGAMQDVILKNLTVDSQHKYQIDIAISLPLYGQSRSHIAMLGDMSPYAGYFEFDATGWQYQQGKGYELNAEEVLILNDAVYFRLLKRGFSYFIGDESNIQIDTRLPVSLNPPSISKAHPSLYSNGTFLLKDKKAIKMAVIEGQVYDLRTNKLLN